MGGPMDGNRQPIDAETNQLSVVMTDGQQLRYLRTEEIQTMRTVRAGLSSPGKGATSDRITRHTPR